MKKIKQILNKNKQGLHITDIVRLSEYSRSKVRTILAMLEGAKKVNIRRVGMAKIYSLSK